MIIYFSATGNCLYVARRIAREGEAVLSIVDLAREGSYSLEDEAVGIVTPTYVATLPTIVRDYLDKADIKTDYLYFVATYGMAPAGIWHEAEKHLRRRPDAFFSVRMPDTWTPAFDLSTPEAVSKFTQPTEQHINEVVQGVRKRVTGNRMHGRMPGFVSERVAPQYEELRKTSHLSVDGDCIGCGKCERNCPAHAIRMENGHPVWIKDQCIMCLGCLHRCPKFAIQYDSSTREHGQYHNPHTGEILLQDGNGKSAGSR